MSAPVVKILAVKLREIGDTVIWTSALAVLREKFPHAEIHVLTYRSNASILRHLKSVDHLHFLNTHSRWELMTTLLRLRWLGLDWLLGFNANTSLCRWAWLAGAKKMALHHFSWSHTPLGSVSVPNAGELEDAIARDLRVLETMGLTVHKAPTQLAIQPEELAEAEKGLRQAIAAIGGDVEARRFLFMPGARHPLHRYPLELWLPMARQVREAGRFQPVVLSDQALSEELGLREACRENGLPLLDDGNLRQFLARVACGDRAFTNDSAPGHIAVALGLKTWMVFGPGCPGDWHPYDRERHPLVYTHVPCRDRGPRDRQEFQFCTVEKCSHHRCMRELKIDLS